jgi:hypothetical protein
MTHAKIMVELRQRLADRRRLRQHQHRRHQLLLRAAPPRIRDVRARPALSMKATARAKFAASLTASVVGCGLSLGGQAVLEGPEGGPSPGVEGGDLTMGSSGGSASGGSSSGNLFDQGPVADDATADGKLGDGGSPAFDAAVSVMDADAAATLPEGGPSHGTMGCPPSSDAAPCGLTSDVCCTCPGCFAPYPTNCLPALTGCVGVVFSGFYARLTCGDVTNCASGSVCCTIYNSASVLTGSSCLPVCPPGGDQLCSTGAECAAGKTCRPLTSVPGFSGCQ